MGLCAGIVMAIPSKIYLERLFLRNLGEPFAMKEIDGNRPKRFYSPSSKAPVMTPIKSALYSSNKQTRKFIKKIQELLDVKNKENAEDVMSEECDDVDYK
jgi:hypothetical protein